MFNGEVDHVESPSRDDSHQESETTTPSKEIAEVEDFKPSADEPGDPQVCTLNRLVILSACTCLLLTLIHEQALSARAVGRAYLRPREDFRRVDYQRQNRGRPLSRARIA